ncbi:tetratricopeptide repeat protein [Methylobacterium sp. J-090]|uniref:tetratricopeptide repeat protein n=1 Tax=Methylobacterium sp. J-090 TaxID=2836666 RepID=UPI001FB99CBD|nr:tetratricopeptide repeat protein [Methylobacterium sp. J-090]MCJ2081726.1 tetratricopeptide repeat protein [Methylobacterium sp. J-090]
MTVPAKNGPAGGMPAEAPEDARDPAPPTQHRLPVDNALELAVQLHRSGEVVIAERVYRRILESIPDQPDATHYLGVLHHATGRSDEAVRLIRRAIALNGDDPGMRNNLGNVLSELGRAEEAAEAYFAAFERDPSNLDVLNNLGVTLRALNRFNDSEAAYRRVIALDPTHREAHDNLGRLLASRGRFDEAAACHQRALTLEPRNAETRRLLADMHAMRGDRAKAVAVLDDWLDDEPGSVTARHLRAAISGEDVPARASDDYVALVFDRFAASFDRKLQSLDYRAPTLVADALAAVVAPGAALDILDAGCGTGLCGPLVAVWARRLDGVDLSEEMLARAARRDCYHALAHAELTRFLGDRPGAYDLVLSADTLCYFGDLSGALLAARHALRPDGRLIFTVEAASEDSASGSFTLNHHGRYSHGAAYVTEALVAAGFVPETVGRHTLRLQRGEPVAGLVVTARRAEGDAPQPLSLSR